MRAARCLTVAAACGLIAWAGAPAATAQDLSAEASLTGGPIEQAGDREQKGGFGAFGTQLQDLWLDVTDFLPATAGTSWQSVSANYWTLNGQTATADIPLPAGAMLRGLECFGYDADAADITVRLFINCYEYATNTNSGTPLGSIASSGTAGYQTFSRNDLDRTISYRPGNAHCVHSLTVYTPNTNLRFRGCSLSWQRQISIAPATATFPNDVPTSHPFFRYVEALAAAGITGGCAAGSYCPDSPVTRGQMAVFLAVSLGLHWPY